MKKFLIIDGNSLGHFSNNGAKLSLGDMPIQAVYNFVKNLRSVCMMLAEYEPIVLWDGASWRKMLFSEYKEHRNKDDKPYLRKALEAKSEYERQVPLIKKALTLLGISQVFALNMEADDLAAIMADRYASQGSHVVLYTADKDWLQLVGPNVFVKDFLGKKLVTPKNFKEITGVDTSAKFVEVKALAGDDGDLGPGSGVGGIGHKGAVQFINEYGSVGNFFNQVCLEKTIDPASLPKKFRLLAEDENKMIRFNRNIDLMDLRTKQRPDMVGFKVTKGQASAQGFEILADKLMFQSITKDIDQWLSVFPAFREKG